MIINMEMRKINVIENNWEHSRNKSPLKCVNRVNVNNENKERNEAYKPRKYEAKIMAM